MLKASQSVEPSRESVKSNVIELRRIECPESEIPSLEDEAAFILPSTEQEKIPVPKPPFVMMPEMAYITVTNDILRECKTHICVTAYWALYHLSYGTAARKNYCQISLNTLAKTVGMRYGTLRVALRKLCRARFIRQNVQGNGQATSHYLIGRLLVSTGKIKKGCHNTAPRVSNGSTQGVTIQHPLDLLTDKQINRTPYSPPSRGTFKTKSKSKIKRPRGISDQEWERRQAAVIAWGHGP